MSSNVDFRQWGIVAYNYIHVYSSVLKVEICELNSQISTLSTLTELNQGAAKLE